LSRICSSYCKSDVLQCRAEWNRNYSKYTSTHINWNLWPCIPITVTFYLLMWKHIVVILSPEKG